MDQEVKIEKVNLSGETLYRIKAQNPPHGTCFLVSEDSSDSSLSNLISIARQWDELWPAMFKFIETEGAEYGCDSPISGTQDHDGDGILSVGVGLIREGEYLSDKANVLVSIEFDEPPLWNFFIKDNQITHAQPVF
jgi:hypothetical protein